MTTHRPERFSRTPAGRGWSIRRGDAPDLSGRAIGWHAVGLARIGAIALGAMAMGALAIGALAIGRLVIGRARFRHLHVDEFVVCRLDVRK